VLAGILTNILLYHVTMDPAGIPPGLVATVLWFVTAVSYRANFRGIFVARAEPAAAPIASRLAG
jgi:putative oxidoreductase